MLPGDEIRWHRSVLILAQVMAWCHQAITWTNVDLLLMRFCDIHLRAISQRVPMINLLYIEFEIILSKLLPHFPGANELYHFAVFDIPRSGHRYTDGTQAECLIVTVNTVGCQVFNASGEEQSAWWPLLFSLDKSNSLIQTGAFLCPIHWSHVLSREWRCGWSSADRRCSNYIWVVSNFITY